MSNLQLINGGQMKTLRILMLLVLPLTLFSSNLNAQEKQNLDKQPEPIGGIKAIAKNVVYPEKARQVKMQGKVMLKVEINEKGEVEKVYVERGVDKMLDEAAIKAVKATKFTPGEMNGKKVKAELVIPVKFELCKEKKT